jgi:hypothetical protein
MDASLFAISLWYQKRFLSGIEVVWWFDSHQVRFFGIVVVWSFESHQVRHDDDDETILDSKRTTVVESVTSCIVFHKLTMSALDGGRQAKSLRNQVSWRHRYMYCRICSRNYTPSTFSTCRAINQPGQSFLTLLKW